MSKIHLTYNKLWSQATRSIENNSVTQDSNLLDKGSDFRRGLTLICRPSICTQDAVKEFLKEIQKIEPDQYYYKPTELHTTVMTIITNHVDFKINQLDTAAYVEALTQSIAPISSLTIAYKGITASPDCVMIQGFPQGKELEDLRQNIRINIKKAGVINTLDGRYKTHTAHMTCLRFQKPGLKNSNELLRFLNKNRGADFGTSKINNLEFVVNDWYMSNEKTEVVHQFPLINQ